MNLRLAWTSYQVSDLKTKTFDFYLSFQMFVNIDKILDKCKCKNVYGLLHHPHFVKKSSKSKGEKCYQHVQEVLVMVDCVILMLYAMKVVFRDCKVVSQVTQTVTI